MKAEGVLGAERRWVQWERSACRWRVRSVEAPELEMGYGEGGRSLGVLLAARLLCGAQPEVVWWGESPFWKREAIARGRVPTSGGT